jgi:hypothetical protein
MRARDIGPADIHARADHAEQRDQEERPQGKDVAADIADKIAMSAPPS